MKLNKKQQNTNVEREDDMGHLVFPLHRQPWVLPVRNKVLGQQQIILIHSLVLYSSPKGNSECYYHCYGIHMEYDNNKKIKTVSLYKPLFFFCKILTGRVRQAGKNYLYCYNSKGALEEPSRSRFESNKIRFLHMMSLWNSAPLGAVNTTSPDWFQKWWD